MTTFERLEEEIDVAGLFAPVSSEKRVREKDVGELVRDLRRLEAEAGPVRQPRQIRAHRIEIHKKFALAGGLPRIRPPRPAARRHDRARRTHRGLLARPGRHPLLLCARSRRERARPWTAASPAVLAMWGPDILLAAAGALLLARSRAADGSSLASAPPGSEARRRSALDRGALRGSPSRSRRSPFPRSSPCRFPGLLDRYVTRKFLALLGLVLAALAAAAFLVSFFERLGDALEQRQVRSGLVFRYATGPGCPSLLAFLLPAAVLTAALLALGFLARTNEATAMKACGVSAYRTALPVLVLAAAAGGLAFLVQERIVPAAHARSEAARLLDPRPGPPQLQLPQPALGPRPERRP
ncbi:MAG: LptF/LptG family permease [Anaerotruncus sp.]|nr:LptF/LptG family permease [Anaerotruncus sp.]